jgi:predicted site-specific integrase-resolvase
MEQNLIKILKLVKDLGVSPKTLLNWNYQGKIEEIVKQLKND